MPETTLQSPTLLVCLQCGSTLRDDHGCKLPNPAAAALAERLQSALADTPVAVRLVRCFSHCSYPIAWALRAENGFCYTFAPAADEAEIAAMARQWLAADHQGRVPKKEMPATVKESVRSRIPPIPQS